MVSVPCRTTTPWAPPSNAAATRSALMERLAESETRMVGYHLPDGGLGRVARAETGYRFIVE